MMTQVITALITLILSAFLPKHYTFLVREFAAFVIKSLISKKIYPILVILLSTFITLYFKNSKHFTIILVTAVAVSILLISTIEFIRVWLYKDSQLNIAYYGCYTHKENSYIVSDADSDNLDAKANRILNTLSNNFFTYRNEIIRFKKIELPKFIPIALGYNGLNKLINNRVTRGNHLASILFVRDINKQGITPIVHFNENIFINKKAFDNAIQLLDDISQNNSISILTNIETSARIFLVIFGQCLVDFLIENKKFDDVHSILDDTTKVIKSLLPICSDIPVYEKEKVVSFTNFWLGYTNRYKAILLTEQKQFLGAVQNIIKSIAFNTYFPYSNYTELKQDFSKRYGIELIPSLIDANEALNIEKSEDYANIENNLSEQISYFESTFNKEIIRNIVIASDFSEEIQAFVYEQLQTLDKSNPFILLTLSEIIRYLKKGEDKFNEIYTERFDESILYLKEAISLDNDFPILHTKLGIMIFIKGLHFENEKIMNEGMVQYKKGMHFISELGFDFN